MLFSKLVFKKSIVFVLELKLNTRTIILSCTGAVFTLSMSLKSDDLCTLQNPLLTAKRNATAKKICFRFDFFSGTFYHLWKLSLLLIHHTESLGKGGYLNFTWGFTKSNVSRVSCDCVNVNSYFI